MQIHWRNIIVLALVIFLVALLGKNCSRVSPAIEAVGRVGPYHSTDDKVVGMLTFGLVCLTIVAIVKILTTRGGK